MLLLHFKGVTLSRRKGHIRPATEPGVDIVNASLEEKLVFLQGSPFEGEGRMNPLQLDNPWIDAEVTFLVTRPLHELRRIFRHTILLASPH